MSEFKKTFRGYNPNEVDSKIEELNLKLTEAENKSKMFKNAVEELKAKEDELNLKISTLEDKISIMNSERLDFEKKLSGNSLPNEKVGKIYIKAYESGEQLALSPKSHIDHLIQDVKSVSDKTRNQFNAAQADFESFSLKIQGMINEIIENNKSMLEKTQNLYTDLSCVGTAYSAFDSLEKMVCSDMKQILEEYKREVGDLAESETPTPFVEKDSYKKVEPKETDVFLEEKKTIKEESFEPVKVEEPTENIQDNTEEIKEETKEDINEETKEVTNITTEQVSEASEKELESNIVPESGSETNEDSEIVEDSVEDFATKQEPSDAQTRGKNIMNLLNKYQKKPS